MFDISREKTPTRSEFPLEKETDLPVPSRNRKSPLSRIEKQFEESNMNFAETGFHQGPTRRGPREIILWSLAALTIDLLITLGLSCLALLSSLYFSHFEYEAFSLFISEHIYFFLLGASLGVLSIYMLMLRIFLGFTLGDWACGLRLGSLKQRLSSNYALLVLARAILVIATGLVVLPILSLFLDKDIAGKLTSLALVSKR